MVLMTHLLVYLISIYSGCTIILNINIIIGYANIPYYKDLKIEKIY